MGSGALTAVGMAMATIAALSFADLVGHGNGARDDSPNRGQMNHASGHRGAANHAAIAELERAVRARPGVARRAEGMLGRSSQGRAITASAINGLGGGHARGAGPMVLAVGCIHGDECAGIKAVARSRRGSPPSGDGVVTVRNLNPDGLALGTRVNARGVDLNRNFPAAWRASRAPGNPEYPGPRPFSEPESRISRELIEALRPDVTIWFHQQEERLVRAWGPSVPAARLYARLAGEPFRRMPWLGGTAPNWQNRRYPGSSSFVVELPLDGPSHPMRHGFAILRLAQELDEKAPALSPRARG